MLPEAPNLAALHRTAAVFNGFANVDRSWLLFAETTAPGVDLSLVDHRTLLLRWLNSWGCRIRYPREGEPAPYDAGVAAWWHTWQASLPSASLADLTDPEIDAAAGAYAELALIEVSARRTLGATAAAKALYALRPLSVMPWDAAIAARLYGARDGAAFARHLRLGREWAAAVLRESDESDLCAALNRPVSLAKILDEYLYVTITMPKER